MKLLFNGTDIKIFDSSTLENFFREIEDVEDIELWLFADDEQSLCALINKSCGWLMFLRYPGDVGLSSRSQEKPKSNGQELPFKLSNGQVDYYPTQWTMDRSIVFKAALEFALSSKRPEFIEWHDDSS